jgi:hypothetical protein
MLFSYINRYVWFQASAAMLMRCALFWDVTQCHVVIVYRRFGTTYRSHSQGSRLQGEKKIILLGP